jgi:hypothetical protein
MIIMEYRKLNSFDNIKNFFLEIISRNLLDEFIVEIMVDTYCRASIPVGMKRVSEGQKLG